ncbi:Nucleotide-binding universal stress protein, UspA family [Salegentibacter echinorum]|uniref:Nucleotide-binding universal stress protein, UspA family n=1 Tax=Salegentibacter echinorum TaxID=1073325 RepID=A0A1M5BIF4_SALEC|nr:universal stress protein [Salegentibacter echinorum]SHF42130.1 Nucleotide-binding universal stress protein, UspA family [Salegentibacter echinorum]
MKILLAIDGSDFSKVAIDELNKLTLSSNCEIHIINVYEAPKSTGLGLHSMGGRTGNYLEEIRSSAQKLGNKIVSEASEKIQRKSKTLSITTSVVGGLAKSAINEKAEDWGADLIVVGSQGHGALSRLILGSVSQYLSTNAKCSVLIARDRNK